MLIRTPNPHKVVRIVTIATLSFMVCWGLLLVLAQIRPFWIDEWRVIYNLKYKTATTLWGPLDFMQQFPRAYLEVIKVFTSIFDYSYFTLRLPSFLVGTATIIFCYRLMKKVYPSHHLNRFLFIMILVSSYTFTEYFVQIKQYTMDILLSLVALWQYTRILELRSSVPFNKTRYLLLCASCLICPFFSYTYPIAMAPVFVIVPLQSFYAWKNDKNNFSKTTLFRQWVPLFLCLSSIVIFYLFDVSQVMADPGMHDFWGYLMMTHGFNLQLFAVNIYNLFAQVGAGLLFNTIFGILGILSFLFSTYKGGCMLVKNKNEIYAPFVLYGTTLLVIVIVLFIAGKIPIGEPRLNAFTVPAISMLIIYFLDALKQNRRMRNFSISLSVILYLGVTGNIYTTCIAGVTGPVYNKKLDIYVSTENAIITAQAKNLPIIIMPEIAYPYDRTRNYPFQNTVPGDWVLKAFPAYKVNEHTPVYALNDLSELKDCMQILPHNITSVLVGDGRSFHIVSR